MDSHAISFDDRGLVPCIVQDAVSGEVLTLAYMNAEALTLTQQTGELHFYSRSRQQLWHKGATSGNRLDVLALRHDCDADAILAIVSARGPACHTGARTCFFAGDHVPAAAHEVLPALERTIVQRRGAGDPESSYTARLLAHPPLIGEKVQEEAEEVVRAAREESDDRVANEAADLLYHLTVLLASRELSLADAERILDERSR
jgi:phosphoribosyl-ATP pyrophosphohydrolase/phosphoribosyl-AMP cyclohydrolase